MTSLIGQSFGRYKIIEKIGEGGMATVYKAHDTRLECDVAIKVIRTERLVPEMAERTLKRFEREAKAVAQLNHPNIVKVIDYGEYNGFPYLVMPYLSGGTLKQHIGKPIPWKDAFYTLAPIARAIEYAHQHGVLHRDIKPSNILLTDAGQPMLSDFGIAKLLNSEETTMDLTGTHMGIGTPEYMAPEQAISNSSDFRADIYSLGVVLYEMITGRRPHKGDTPMATLFKHANEPLIRPSLYVSELPETVEKILLGALAKRPEDRYNSMGIFALKLETAQTKETPTQLPQVLNNNSRKAATKPVYRKKTNTWVIVISIITVICIVTISCLLFIYFAPLSFWCSLPINWGPGACP